MPVTTITSIDDFRSSVESSPLSVVQFGTSCEACNSMCISNYLKYSEQYPMISFYFVDASEHSEIVHDAEIPSLPSGGVPLFLLYEAGEGCVDAVVGADSPNLGRTLELFNPSSPITSPSSSLWSASNFSSPLLSSPVVSFEKRFSQAFVDWQ